jgi:hypothetical protein
MCAGYFRGSVFIEDKLGINTGSTAPQYTLDVNGIVRCNSITYSDSSLKKNVLTLASGNLAKIQKLRGVRYQLKTPSELNQNLSMTSQSDTGKANIPIIDTTKSELYTKDHIGFIAQEIQKVFPELVYSDKKGVLSLNYDGMIPVLLEAIKEQQSTIEGMKNDILLLKKKLNLTTTTVTQADPSTIQ